MHMTIRTRLGLFFVGIVVLPLVAATLAFQMLAARQAEGRTNSRLSPADQATYRAKRAGRDRVEAQSA
jgi:GGDEF domain-containing protein